MHSFGLILGPRQSVVFAKQSFWYTTSSVAMFGVDTRYASRTIFHYSCRGPSKGGHCLLFVPSMVSSFFVEVLINHSDGGCLQDSMSKIGQCPVHSSNIDKRPCDSSDTCLVMREGGSKNALLWNVLQICFYESGTMMRDSV
jgi:hypothetical protein